MKNKNGSSKKIAALKNALRKGIPLSALIAAATVLSGCASEREPVPMGLIERVPNSENEAQELPAPGVMRFDPSDKTPEKPAPKKPNKPAPKKPNAVNEDTNGIAIDGDLTMPVPEKPIEKK